MNISTIISAHSCTNTHVYSNKMIILSNVGKVISRKNEEKRRKEKNKLMQGREGKIHIWKLCTAAISSMISKMNEWKNVSSILLCKVAGVVALCSYLIKQLKMIQNTEYSNDINSGSSSNMMRKWTYKRFSLLPLDRQPFSSM